MNSEWSDDSHFASAKNDEPPKKTPQIHDLRLKDKKTPRKLQIAVSIITIIVIAILGDLAYQGYHHYFPAAKNHQTKHIAAKTQFNTAAIWNTSQSGILAFEGTQNVSVSSDGSSSTVKLPAYVVLLNPSSGSVVAQKALPSSTSQYSNGKSFTLVTTAGNNGSGTNYAFNANYRYIAVQFNQTAGGSQDVGYYDLETGNVTDVSNNNNGDNLSSNTVTDTQPTFDANDPNLLLFQRNGASYSYNLSTLQAQAYSGQTCTAGFVYESNDVCELQGSGPLSSVSFTTNTDNANELTADIPPGSGTFSDIESMQGGQDANIVCAPVMWLDSNNILCNRKPNTNSFDYLKINLGDMTQKTDSNGNNYYEVPPPLPILPSSNQTNTDPVVSSNGGSIMFISTKGSSAGLYTVSTSGYQQPNEILQLDNYNSGHIALLEWR